MSTSTSSSDANTTIVDRVVVRFAGDSGDGVQLTGSEFTKAAALAGNDIATFPDFPAEIRAPAGTLAGVSGFQLHFASNDILTPGDAPNVLVAMNPAALKRNLPDVVLGGTVIVNTGTFLKSNLKKAGYESNPLEGDELANYHVHALDLSKLTNGALEDSSLSPKEKGRCKNFFALGLMYWMYSRATEPAIANIRQKFARKGDELVDANIKAFKAGYHYGETTEVFQNHYEVRPKKVEPGLYRNITGIEALALGLVAAGRLADTPIFFSGYPITPASGILHVLSNYKNYGVTTFQAEDEIAAVCAAIGSAYAGSIAVTASSGPGISLKGEGLALAAMLELPLVCVSVQRGGPSTGLPTKTEQADLFQTLYGRNGECPMPVIAAKTPADNFKAAIEAVRIAVKYVTPVMLLTDGYLANGAEPWKVPDVESLPEIKVVHRTDPEGYFPYKRNPETMARDWVVPGTPGMEHRIGGLEKDALTGNVSYDPVNHETMIKARAAKAQKVAQDCGELDLFGDDSGEVLIVGWGGPFGALRQAAMKLRAEGKRVSHVHLRHLWPFNPRLPALLKSFDQVLVAELNMGQLRAVLRSEYLLDAKGLNKIQGLPFKVAEVEDAVNELLVGRRSAKEAV